MSILFNRRVSLQVDPITSTFVRSIISSSQWCLFHPYQVAFVFNAVTLPWYYASIFTLMGTFRPPLWLIKFTTGVALFIGVSFSGDGNHQLYNWFWVIGMIVVAWFATQWIFEGVPKKRQPEHAG